MRARANHPSYPSNPGSRGKRWLYPISTHTASADEGGNESRGGTEVNYQIDVRPQVHLVPPSRETNPPRTHPSTLRDARARGLSRRIENNFVAVMRPESMISSRRRDVVQKLARSVNTIIASA